MSDALLRVHVTPRASRCEVAGRRGDAVCLRVTAPPVEGAANEAAVSLLAEVLGVRKRQIEIVSGQKGREKTFRVAGLSDAQVRQRLGV